MKLILRFCFILFFAITFYGGYRSKKCECDCSFTVDSITKIYKDSIRHEGYNAALIIKRNEMIIDSQIRELNEINLLLKECYGESQTVN